MKQHATDAEWVRSMMGSLSDAMLPQRWILTDVTRWAYTRRKRPLWLEIGIAGTGVAARIECTTDHRKTPIVLYVGLGYAYSKWACDLVTHWTAKVDE